MKKRTAIVFVHGQGEQRPMDSVRDLAVSTWASDPNFGSKISDSHPHGLRYWSIPDERSDNFELRRLACETDDKNRRFDFFEFYWAHLVTGTSFRHLYSWFNELVARPLSEVPNGLLRIRQIIIRSLETAIAFCLIGMALCVFNLRDDTNGMIGHPLSEMVFSNIEKGSLYIALFIGPLIGALAIAGDWARTSGAREGRTAFNPSAWEKRGLLVLAALIVPLLGLQVAAAENVVHALQDSISALIYIAALLWIARFLTTSLIVSVFGLVLAFVTSLQTFQFTAPSPTEAELSPTLFATLLAPIIVSALTASAFAAASRFTSYIVTAIIALIVFFVATGFFESLGLFPQKEFDSEQIAAIAAAWGIASAVLLPEAARFNRYGLKGALRHWRAGHALQILIWLFFLFAPLALLLDQTFRVNTLTSFFWGIAEDGQFTGIPLIWVIPILYSIIWSVTQRLIPANKNVRPGQSPDEVRTTTPFELLGIQIALWLLWAVYFHNAVFGHQGWSFYWLFTAAFLAFPALIILGILANRSFLIPVMGDSARYLSPAPENIEARQNIRQTGVDLLETLHSDGKYDRIILVAHSLGSVVALDILNQFWAGRLDRIQKNGLGDELRTVQDASSALQSETAPNAPATQHARDAFRQAQTKYRLALHAADRESKSCNEPSLWRVSDFVTLGSPLTYAKFLLAASDAEFDRRMARLELPACPPNERDANEENQFGPGEGVFGYPKGEDQSFGPKHSAVFAAVRWTNLYFNTPGLVTGDLIGGDVSHAFGRGIQNYAIAGRPDKTSFAHNEYWKWFPNHKRRSKRERVSRKELLGLDVPEHIEVLRLALDLADQDAENVSED